MVSSFLDCIILVKYKELLLKDINIWKKIIGHDKLKKMEI